MKLLNKPNVINYVMKYMSTQKSQAPPVRKGDFVPEGAKNDWIGPPHPVSNLRPVYFHVPKDETPTETEFRRRREAVEEWNQKFWELHNDRFYKGKNEFVADYRKVSNDPKEPPAEEMAKFYKRFLDENHNLHMSYNWKWYRLNIGLLWPAVKVYFIRLYKR